MAIDARPCSPLGRELHLHSIAATETQMEGLMRIAGTTIVCLACAAMATPIASCAKAAAAQWKDGAYRGKAERVHGEIDLTVTVKKGWASQPEFFLPTRHQIDGQ